MSWINFNESLSSIKGQLSSFASGVLADGIVGEAENNVGSTRDRIEDGHSNAHHLELKKPPPPVENGNNWSWEPPGEPPPPPRDIITDLRRTIQDLEQEKKELVASLEQLDLDCQQTTDKLVTLKDDLQTNHNELKADFEKLQKEYGNVLEENMQKSKEIECLRQIDTALVDLPAQEQGEDAKQIESLKEECERLKTNLRTDHERLQVDYDSLRVELEELKQLKDADDSNLINLHAKYLRIITENMKKYIDSDAAAMSPLLPDEQPQVLEFAGKVEALLKLLLDFKCKTEALEKDLCAVTQDKTKAIAEKNFEIERLLKNSEILSQEVITKTQAIKDYEDECGELMKNNDLLIAELQNYKNGGGLQTISEGNEDNLLLLESQLEGSNKRVQDLELIISDLESSKQEANLETQTELDYIKKQLNMTGQELNHSKEAYQELLARLDCSEQEKRKLKSTLEKLKFEYENTEYRYTEANVSMETLKEENEEIQCKLVDLDTSGKKLESRNFNLENKIELLQDIVDELKQKLDAEAQNTSDKEAQIQGLVERLQNSKMCETGLKLQVDTICKELQIANEAKQNLEAKCTQLESSPADLEIELENNRAMNTALSQKIGELHQQVAFLEAQLAEVSSSRNELVGLITAKHQENVQYHEEIQRLTQLLAETNPSHEELIRTNDEIQKQYEKLTDQNGFLREKCEVLAQNLLQEQASMQKAVSDRLAASDREQTAAKELERLRAHLVEIEEMYTQELLAAEQKNKEMWGKVNAIEQREKDSSSMYTSVSIRANQQVETLQSQLQLVTNQRDELRTKISDLEDEHNKQVAALTNLQLVLGQFQKEKEQDVRTETERVRRQVGVERQIQGELRGEISGLKVQLEESKQGLQAASRLSDQLEKCKRQIVSLKDEVTKLQDQQKSGDAKYKELTTQTDSKVDKTLIKNLIVGYISSHSSDQNQILKIIATVLDFNQKESDKVNLNKPQQGWLNSILHPQGSDSQQSLSEAFVRFLENESKPKVLPNLLNTNQGRRMEGSGSSSSGTTPRQSPSPLVLSEVLLPTFVDFGKSRNSSSILKDVLKDNS